MLKAFIIFSLSIFLTSINTYHHSNCFPENSLSFPVDAKAATGLTQAQFTSVLDEFEDIMSDEVQAVQSADLELKRRWESDTVNAVAYQTGNSRFVEMYGGLARHPETTTDVYRMVACHELGHHLGGAPKKSGGGIWGSSSAWASNEGQADYYSGSKCFRRLIIEGRKAGYDMDGPALSTYPKSEVKFAKSHCNKSFTDSEDIEICVRTAMGAYSIGRLFSSFRPNPVSVSLETPDTSSVYSTDDSHPDSQCRIDTYFQGGLCDISYRERVSDSDANFHTCNRKDNYKVGLRPTCWYKPSSI